LQSGLTYKKKRKGGKNNETLLLLKCLGKPEKMQQKRSKKNQAKPETWMAQTKDGTKRHGM
jgi:hypothetical protein